jgi:cation transport regulator ChaC
MYLFGFGSLINLASAQKSFKRVLTQDDLIPIKIKGYERVWNAIESIQFDDELVNGVFLNIQKNENSILDGVVIEISQEELEVLKLREKNYSCITIQSKDILNKDFKSDLIAFMTTNEKKLAKVGDLNTFIPAKYIQIIKEALKNYDDDFVKGFKKSLENYPFSLKEGSYIFTDPIQNNVAREGIKKQDESK